MRPELLEDLLKRVYSLSYGQVSPHKAKLPSNECNKKDHALNGIKQLKLISSNKTKGCQATQTIGPFFAKWPFAFGEKVPDSQDPSSCVNPS